MIDDLYKEIKEMLILGGFDARGFFEKLKQVFLSKSVVHKQCIVPLDNFEFSTTAFYEMIEKELTVRKMPGLDIARIEVSEGGPLSPNRQYLRLRRERLVFDICAAPFGTGYFFSFRSGELPYNISIPQLLVFAIVSWMLYAWVVHFIGWISGILLFFVVAGGLIWFLHNIVALGFKDMDAALLVFPTIGPLYEVFFRSETYYREDTRSMYLSIVDAVTKALVEEVTAAKGIKLAERYNRPVFDELNREKADPEASATRDSKAD
jgi:hypothetical protein